MSIEDRLDRIERILLDYIYDNDFGWYIHNDLDDIRKEHDIAIKIKETLNEAEKASLDAILFGQGTVEVSEDGAKHVPYEPFPEEQDQADRYSRFNKKLKKIIDPENEE